LRPCTPIPLQRFLYHASSRLVHLSLSCNLMHVHASFFGLTAKGQIFVCTALTADPVVCMLFCPSGFALSGPLCSPLDLLRCSVIFSRLCVPARETQARAGSKLIVIRFLMSPNDRREFISQQPRPSSCARTFRFAVGFPSPPVRS